MASTYSPESQMNFVIQWFKGWSEFQKEDFVAVLSQRIKEGGKDNKNGGDAGDNNLVNGFKALQTAEGRPPSLFVCQVKLFNEWWTVWSPSDRDKMTVLFKEADSKFYTAVESDISGESQKLNEDFMAVPIPGEEGGQLASNGNMNGDAKQEAPIFNVTKVIINNGPSSFSSSIENEDVNGGADEGNHVKGDSVSNGNCESAVPIATEI